jgi:hypothetical protein
MKKSIILLLFLCVFLCSGNAQASAPDSPQLPSGPLIVAQMPDLAQWSVDSTYSDAAKADQPSALDRYRKEAEKDPALAKAIADPQYLLTLLNPRPTQVLYSKSGNIRHEVRTLELGYKRELWAKGEIMVERKPGIPDLVASIFDASGLDAFPEFDWIARNNFVGSQIYNNVKCFAFKMDVYDDQHHFLGTKFAYIDQKTLYPLGYIFGTETRKYTILPPLTSELTVPDDFLAAGKAMLARVQRATPHLGPP